MMRRGVVLLAVFGLAACTQEESITPSTGATGESTTTIDQVPETSPETTTTVAPDTTPAAQTSVVETAPTPDTVAAESTTTVAATGNPTTVSTEYFLGGDPDAWLYLGRWTGNDWEADRDADQQLREPTASNGDAVFVHELDVAPIPGTIDGSGEACAVDGRSGPVISPNARAPQDPGFGYRSIAFASDWSTVPRPVAVVSASVDSYVAAGQAAFADTGVDASSGTIQQLVVADLDGDGDTESLVAFGGDGFSTLLLIDANTGASIRVARSVATSATPATPATPTTVAEGDAPGETTAVPADTFRTLAVVDLNGDGRFEIVTHAFEGSSAEVTVSTYDGTEVTGVLTAGC